MRIFLLSLFFIFFTLSSYIESQSQLARQWVARYSAGKGIKSAGTAMVTDDSGYAYVGGWTTSKLTGVDFITLRYSPEGALMWAKTYAGGGTSVDKVTAIAIDSAENVYVTGVSNGDIATVKYDIAGNQQWAVTYTGAGGGEDAPVAVAVNDSLNVFVAGKITGSGTGLDFVTLKYNILGVLQWERQYNGPANGSDYPTAMVLKGNTELYVTGASADTMLDYLTIRYVPTTGDTTWISRYNGPDNLNDIARAMVVRTSSEIYITGGSQDSLTGYDYATILLNGSGEVEWASRYNGSANGDDQANSISLQSNSRVFVTGRSLQTGSFNDIVTVRYNQSNGDENWVSVFNGSGNDDDNGVGVIGAGSPYVIGATSGVGNGLNYTLILLDGSGDTDWSVNYNGVANDNDIPAAYSSRSGVYITGSSIGGGTSTDILTVRYKDAKKLRYRTVIQESLATKPAAIKKGGTPNMGNLRDTIFFRAYPKIKKGLPGAPGGMVLGMVRTDSATAYGWIRLDKGKALSTFVPHTGAARGFDLYGGVAFVGEKKGPKLAAYNNHLLGELMTLKLNIAASDVEITPPTFGDIEYDDGDTANPYNKKTLRQLASLVDNLLSYWKKYPSISSTQWNLFDTILTRVNHAFTSPLRSVSSSPYVVTGDVHIDSISFLNPPDKITEPITLPSEILEPMPTKYSLRQNYPNPFNPSTTIEFDLPEDALVTIKIFDVLGREITTLLNNEELEAGVQEISFDASALNAGVYFYRITVNDGSFQQVRKMVLVK